ncbi:ORF35 [Retroperitoneal fibromatosis-associated herpesvirus]|uniref:ORF35 n=1 Tax=Retroperitoneal fibromatosis-associated herpesvirus TaxID=111469 RepID=U5NM07_9GAMA|nr:ORF35 [Retroperitoneal fibromatosis-associated herpesvirus]AGY30717.1 ORF35 [Retroperitoneal fibromatosis-associated herpesvirus]
MDSRNTKRDFIKSALTVDVQRKTAVSLFDRFGAGSAIFERQFIDARAAERSHGTLQRQTKLRDLAREVHQKFENAKKERVALGDHRALPSTEEIDALGDTVADLKETVTARLDALEEHGVDCPGDGTEEVQDTILHWRLGRLPPMCPGTP